MAKLHPRNLVILTLRICVLTLALSFTLFAQSRNPVILIPGLSGSELRHKDTGERIWFKALKQKSEDLKLPISEDITANHDQLIPGDILRTLKLGVIPVSDVYGGIIEAFELRAGYHEEKWDSPSAKGADRAIYVFPYDWRLDNVENARILVKKIEGLKARLKVPDLKFDIVSHSMGGLIARYAAMYGDADLPEGKRQPRPTWAGSKHFDKIILMGTPNEGSVKALNSLLNGFLVNGVRVELPFFQDSSKFTAFTMPAVYQLLPAPGTLRAYNDRLEAMEVDIYDPKTWTKYGWNVIDDKLFADKFDKAELKSAERYFAAVLGRAKRLHQALSAASGDTGGVSFYVLGSECRKSFDSMVIIRDEANRKWKTIFTPQPFTRADGSQVTESELKKIMMMPGDGIVTRRSLEAATQTSVIGVPVVPVKAPGKFVCEDHTKLPRNRQIQDHIFAVLSGSTSTMLTTAASR
jgi:pimeloyl-ACP methyl ester carboxylesterase